MKKNIIFNLTLEQYNKKYRNRRHKLLKYTKKQLEDFDKQYNHYIYNDKKYNLISNHHLLKNRKWALIEDTYYEIPKAISFTWFRNLNTGVQVGVCLIAGGIVASSIAIPIVMTQHKWIDLGSADSAIEFINKTYSDKVSETLKSVDSEYDARGTTTVTSEEAYFIKEFGNEYVPNSLYFKGSLTSASSCAHFKSIKDYYEPIISSNTITYIDGMYGNDAKYYKNGNEFSIKVKQESNTSKNELSIYYNSNGQCTDIIYNSYSTEVSGAVAKFNSKDVLKYK